MTNPPEISIVQTSEYCVTKELGPTPGNPFLLLTFHFNDKKTTRVTTNCYESVLDANQNITTLMSYPHASIGIEGHDKGHPTTVLVNLSQVAFLTIDPVASETSEAE